MTRKKIILPDISLIPEKHFPLYMTERHREALTGIFVLYKMTASRVIERGLTRRFDLSKFPPSEGPYPIKFTLKAKPELLQKLDEIAQTSDCSRAEVVRRILDFATEAWEREEENRKKVELSFYNEFVVPDASAIRLTI